MATKVIHRSLKLDQDGSGLKIGLVSAHSHAEVVGPLVTGTKKALLEWGVARRSLRYSHVNRPFELPFAAKSLMQREKSGGTGLDAVICLGCVIPSEPLGRFEFESEAVALGIMKMNLKGDIPVIYGVLTCESQEQALNYVGEGTNVSGSEYVKEDHGWEWAKAAVSLARLAKSLREDEKDAARSFRGHDDA